MIARHPDDFRKFLDTERKNPFEILDTLTDITSQDYQSSEKSDNALSARRFFSAPTCRSEIAQSFKVVNNHVE